MVGRRQAEGQLHSNLKSRTTAAPNASTARTSASSIGPNTCLPTRELEHFSVRACKQESAGSGDRRERRPQGAATAGSMHTRRYGTSPPGLSPSRDYKRSCQVPKSGSSAYRAAASCG